MLRVLSLVRPAWPRLVGAAALGTLATASGVALLAVSAWLITRAAGMPPVLTLLVAIVGVRTFGIGRAVFRYTERVVAHDAALRAIVEVRVQLYRALERVAPAHFWRSGDLLQRLSADVDATADVVIRGWLPVVSSTVVLVAASGAVLLILPAAGVWLLGAIGVALAVLAVAAQRTGRLESAATAAGIERFAVLNEAVDAAADPAVALDPRWRTRLAGLDRAEERFATRAGIWAGGANAVAVVAMGAAIIASWLIGRQSGIDGESLTIVLLLPLALVDVLTAFGAAAGQLGLGRLVADRVHGVLDLAPADLDTPEPAPPPPPVRLTVRDLSVRWPGRAEPALGPVDLDLAPGRKIAVVGPSGSGKSTLIAALLGFVPFTGRILMDGIDDPHAARRQAMSLCDQQAYLFDSSIAENVRLARADAGDALVLDTIRRARLGPWVDSLPEGMSTRVGHLGALVSGGQRQRIAYARALLAERPILLLDEPTAGLDELTAAALIADLLAAGPDVCVVLVTHETEQLAEFDAVVEMPAVDMRVRR